MSAYMVSSEARYCISTLVLAPLAAPATPTKLKGPRRKAEALWMHGVKTALCPMLRECDPKRRNRRR